MTALPPSNKFDRSPVVVVGLGYVGIPLVIEASRAGMAVQGLDANEHLVAKLNSGRSHIDDFGDDTIATILEAGFSATTNPEALASARTVVICVPTPLAPEGGPDLTAVLAVADEISRRLQPGSLVVLESTTWPGTTEEILLPLLEAGGMVCGEDFYLAFSPERIDPGNPTYGLRNTPKIVGGYTQACTQRAVDFYSRLVDQVVVAKGTREAEMAKLLENTYRHINIALVNEMAKFSADLAVDLWDVIRCAATKPFGFQAFYPGPGVGGHCIPIDPNYLSYKVRAQLGYPFRFVELAQEINQSMPTYVANRVQAALNDQRKPLRGAKVLLLGVTYKANVADERESPARPLAARLLKFGADVSYHDPYVSSWAVNGTIVPRCELEDADEKDLVVLLQTHDEYATHLPLVDTVILDTRGALPASPNVVPL